MADEAVKKVAKKGAKKAKVAKKAAKKSAAVKSNKSSIPVEDVVKMMQRKGGVTLADMKAAGFNQPAMSAVKAAERRDLKPKVTKNEGEPTVYSCNK